MWQNMWHDDAVLGKMWSLRCHMWQIKWHYVIICDKLRGTALQYVAKWMALCSNFCHSGGTAFLYVANQMEIYLILWQTSDTMLQNVAHRVSLHLNMWQKMCI